MDRVEHALLPGIFYLLLQEPAKHVHAHHGGIDDLSLHKREGVLQDGRLTRFVHVLDPYARLLGDGLRALGGAEVPLGHRGHMGPRFSRPLAH